jgi:hypothetical protein
MALHHFLTFKVIALASGVLTAGATMIAVLDPAAFKVAIIVACIAAVPGIFTAVCVLVLGLAQLKHSKKLLANQNEMKISVDGNLSKIIANSERRAVELDDTSSKLSHAEGRREGVEATETKHETQ